MTEEIQSLITAFGLKTEEVENLSDDELKTYFNYYHGKTYPTSSLLIYGFNDKERKQLSAIAKNCKFKVATKPEEFIFTDTNVIAFLCSDNIEPTTLEQAKGYGTVVLKKDFFEKFHTAFFTQEILLQNTDFLFDKNIPTEYRIIKPLSNHDKNVKVNSFSFDSDETYSVNLYKMTCSCKDFQEKQRATLPIGDIRRLCKHLMKEYKYTIGLTGLSDFNKNIFDEGYALKKNFRNIKVETVAHPVIINYDTANDWWNIYFPSPSGAYKRYGYSPQDERFSYDDKPRGFVKPLRLKLKELHSQLTGYYPPPTTNKRQSTTPTPYKRPSNYNQPSNSDYYPQPYQNSTNNDKPVNTGCVPYVILFFVLCLIISLFKC